MLSENACKALHLYEEMLFAKITIMQPKKSKLAEILNNYEVD